MDESTKQPEKKVVKDKTERSKPNQETSNQVSEEKGVLESTYNIMSSAGKTTSKAGGTASTWINQQISEGYTLLSNSLNSSKVIVEPTSREILKYFSSAYESLAKQGSKTVNNTTILINAILASDFSRNMDSWLGATFNEGIPSVYDKAVDAVYNTTHIGGGHLHRLFDGSHTVWGMWDKVREASPDDTFLQEVTGYATALGKDLSSSVGIPLFDWSKSSYDQVATALNTNFNIPKPWFSDFLHVNTTELIGTSICTIALALNWNKKQVKEFARLAGSLGVFAIASANPALAVVALVTLAKSFVDARQKGDYTEFVNGLVKGGVGAGIFLATASAIGGPVWVGIVAGICIGLVVDRAMDTVDISQITTFVESSLKKATAQLENGNREGN